MKALRSGIVLFTLAAVGSLLLGAGGEVSGAEKVRFSLSWIPYGKYAGFYAAAAQGYYKENGLDVAIERGYGAGDTIKKLAAGTVDVAEAGIDSLVVARARGSKVMATGVWHAKTLHVIYSLKGSGITGPKDLVGRTVGTAAGDDGYLIFPALAAKAGIDPGKVNFRIMEGAAKNPSLAAGSVDAIITYVTVLPAIQSVVAKVGKELASIQYADYGVDAYSNGIVVAETTLGSRAETIRRFLNGTYRGLLYGVENPEAAVRQFVKMEPANDLAISRRTWAIAVEHLIDDYSRQEGLGHISREKMEYTRDLMVTYMKLSTKEPVEKIYTNAYLPKLFPKK